AVRFALRAGATAINGDRLHAGRPFGVAEAGLKGWPYISRRSAVDWPTRKMTSSAGRIIATPTRATGRPWSTSSRVTSCDRFHEECLLRHAPGHPKAAHRLWLKERNSGILQSLTVAEHGGANKGRSDHAPNRGTTRRSRPGG